MILSHGSSFVWFVILSLSVSIDCSRLLVHGENTSMSAWKFPVLSFPSTISMDNIRYVTPNLDDNNGNPLVLYQKDKDPTQQQHSKGTTMHQRSLQQGCIANMTSLRNAIFNAPTNNLTMVTELILCSNYFDLSTGGFTIHKKNIHFLCVLNDPSEKCVFDANAKNRHFYIDRAVATFQNISFIKAKNATPYAAGGAIYAYNSSINLIDCDFVGNTAYSGGAFYAHNSNVSVSRCNFRNNIAGHSGGAIDARSSNITLIGSDDSSHPTIFEDNHVYSELHVSNLGGGALFLHSNVVMNKHIMFRSNTAVSFAILSTISSLNIAI
jgi:predicted outer membrane repeat protein